MAADPTLSIRRLAQEYGVDEATLRRRLPSRELSGPHYADPEPALTDELPVIVRDYSHMDKLKVYPMGDFHIGSPRHARGKLDEWLGFIQDTPNATVLNTGDNWNVAIPGSKSDVFGELLTPQEGLEDFERRFEPLADDGRLDVLTGGNHEARIYRATGIDLARVAARTLGVEHFEGAAVIVYLVGDQRYTFFVRHGTGNAPTSMNALTKSGFIIPADLYITGHTHRQGLVLEDRFELVDHEGRLRAVRRTGRYVSSGSFVGYERYAAERGYAPSHLGAPRIHLSGRSHDVHVSI